MDRHKALDKIHQIQSAYRNEDVGFQTAKIRYVKSLGFNGIMPKAGAAVCSTVEHAEIAIDRGERTPEQCVALAMLAFQS